MHFKRKIVDNSKVIVDLVSKKQFLVFLYNDSESWEDDEIKIKQLSGEFRVFLK